MEKILDELEQASAWLEEARQAVESLKQHSISYRDAAEEIRQANTATFEALNGSQQLLREAHLRITEWTSHVAARIEEATGDIQKTIAAIRQVDGPALIRAFDELSAKLSRTVEGMPDAISPQVVDALASRSREHLNEALDTLATQVRANEQALVDRVDALVTHSREHLTEALDTLATQVQATEQGLVARVDAISADQAQLAKRLNWAIALSAAAAATGVIGLLMALIK